MTSLPRPHRVTPTQRPDGVDLHVEGYARHLLADVLNLLGEQPDLRDLFDRVIDGDAPQHDPHRPDVPSRDDVLIDEIVRGLDPASLAIRLHGPAVEKLAATLTRNLPAHGLPEQRRAA